MNSKKLCLELVQAESEEQVTKIINSHPILKDGENWKRYGKQPNNIGTVTGQSPKAVPSLIEKITNSIDAMLIKACKEYGDNPESSIAPTSMEEALEKYFKLNDQKYCDLSNKERRELALNIQIIAEGSKKKPNIIIYDNGEGQHPKDFPTTLVSLNEDNKAKILFVQGKYNIGGTAVLPFCGEKRYQLIISKKNILDDSNGKYGFTLIRRNRGEGQNVKVSWYEYFVDTNNNIFEFDSDPLDLGLINKEFSGGTYIKLFNYDLRNPSNIAIDLWRDLNRYLFSPALPIVVYEKREYSGKAPSKLMHGNRLRAHIDDRENIENIFPMNLKINNVEFACEIYVFKKDVKRREFIQDMAVIFTVNGQVQHSLDNNFISQKAKKAYLKGSLLVNVDCSKMPRILHEDIFMSSRSEMRDNDFYRDLVENIARELNDSEYLTRLDEQRRKDQIFENPKDEEFLKKIMSKLLNDDKEFEKIFGIDAGILSSMVKNIKKELKVGKNGFKSERFPSFFKFKNLNPGNIKMMPQNGECKLEIETDVEDEFLIRPHDKGELKIKIQKPHPRAGQNTLLPGEEDDEVLDVNTIGPNEGSIKLRVKSKKKLEVGTQIPLNIEMISADGSFVLNANIKIDNPREKTDKSDVKTRKEYSLPKCYEVYENERENIENSICWNSLSWTDTDICKVQESSREGALIDAVYVNMDPRELHNYIRAKKITGKNIERITRTYKTAVYLISLVLYYQLSQQLKFQENNSYENDQINYDPSKMVSDLMKGLAKILIHITTNERLLKEIEDLD